MGMVQLPEMEIVKYRELDAAHVRRCDTGVGAGKMLDTRANPASRMADGVVLPMRSGIAQHPKKKQIVSNPIRWSPADRLDRPSLNGSDASFFDNLGIAIQGMKKLGICCASTARGI